LLFGFFKVWDFRKVECGEIYFLENGATLFVSILGVWNVHWGRHGLENVGVQFLDPVVYHIVVALVEKNDGIACLGMWVYLGRRLLWFFGMRTTHSETFEATFGRLLLSHFEAIERGLLKATTLLICFLFGGFSHFKCSKCSPFLLGCFCHFE
jgi:hypothetical protein